MHRKNAAYLFGTVAIIAVMAGCASKPQVTAQQESTGYLSRARGTYRPPGPPSDPWGPYISEASAKYDVPEKWIREVMRQESGGHLYSHGGELITSGAGAMGLMQVMPATYDDLRGRYRELGDDPYDPHNNVLAGTAYLREMYDIYGSPGFLAAYNAGPGRLDDYLTRNRTLPTETRRYVAAIGPRLAGHEPQRSSPGEMYAMNSMPLDVSTGQRYPQPGTQFAATLPTPVEVAEAPRPFIKLAPPAPLYAAPPVMMAQAQPSRQYITLSAPQPEDAAPITAPVAAVPFAVAQAETPQQFIKLNPPAPIVAAPLPQSYAPSIIADAAPAPRYAQFEPEPQHATLGARTPIQSARELPIPEPPPLPQLVYTPRNQFARHAAPAMGRPIEVAMVPEPPRPPSQRAAAAAELVALGPHTRGFGLISSANATPAHMLPLAPLVTARSGAWAVQVGAFANENLAHSATASAREHARDVLGGARSQVAGVRQPGGTLYRARLGGLSRDAAAEACERLSRARTNCMVVSPEAQH